MTKVLLATSPNLPTPMISSLLSVYKFSLIYLYTHAYMCICTDIHLCAYAYIYIYAFTKTHVCTQACPKLVLQIQRKHRVRTNITRTKNMNIFGSLQKQVNLENLHFGSRRFNGLNTAKGCQGGTIFKHRP